MPLGGEKNQGRIKGPTCPGIKPCNVTIPGIRPSVIWAQHSLTANLAHPWTEDAGVIVRTADSGTGYVCGWFISAKEGIVGMIFVKQAIPGHVELKTKQVQFDNIVVFKIVKSNSFCIFYFLRLGGKYLQLKPSVKESGFIPRCTLHTRLDMRG